MEYPEIIPRPADSLHIAVYFNHLLITNGTRGSVFDAMFGIRWGHVSVGLLPPTDHPFVRLACEGRKRLSNYAGANKKEPLTADMLRLLMDAESYTTNAIYRRIVIICLRFCSFFKDRRSTQYSGQGHHIFPVIYDYNDTQVQKRSIKRRQPYSRSEITIQILSSFKHSCIHTHLGSATRTLYHFQTCTNQE